MGKKRTITRYSLTKDDPTKTMKINLAVTLVARWDTTRSSVSRGYVPNVKEWVMMPMFAPLLKGKRASRAGLSRIDDYMTEESRETSRLTSAVGNT